MLQTMRLRHSTNAQKCAPQSAKRKIAQKSIYTDADYCGMTVRCESRRGGRGYTLKVLVCQSIRYGFVKRAYYYAKHKGRKMAKQARRSTEGMRHNCYIHEPWRAQATITELPAFESTCPKMTRQDTTVMQEREHDVEIHFSMAAVPTIAAAKENKPLFLLPYLEAKHAKKMEKEKAGPKILFDMMHDVKEKQGAVFSIMHENKMPEQLLNLPHENNSSKHEVSVHHHGFSEAFFNVAFAGINVYGHGGHGHHIHGQHHAHHIHHEHGHHHHGHHNHDGFQSAFFNVHFGGLNAYAHGQKGIHVEHHHHGHHHGTGHHTHKCEHSHKQEHHGHQKHHHIHHEGHHPEHHHHGHHSRHHEPHHTQHRYEHNHRQDHGHHLHHQKHHEGHHPEHHHHGHQKHTHANSGHDQFAVFFRSYLRIAGFDPYAVCIANHSAHAIKIAPIQLQQLRVEELPKSGRGLIGIEMPVHEKRVYYPKVIHIIPPPPPSQ